MQNVNKNIQPARRISNVQEYYFSRKLKEIAQLNAAGANIISLGVGGPDRMPHPAVIQTLCSEALRPDAHGYQPYEGLPALRQAFAQWYQHWYGVDLNPDNEILPLIGSKEGITHITLAFINPGDGVLVPNPGYPTYTSVSKLAEAQIHYYNLKEENNWMPDFNELEQMPTDNIKLMWVNYPSMPMGQPASRQTFERLIDFGRRHNIVIVNDNPYSFILNDEPISILSIDGAKDIAIELNSLSKSHNMPGWRIAMLATNSQFLQWILRVKSNVDSGQFRPMMLAAVKALSAGDRNWFKQLNDEYATRRKIAEEIMLALNCRFNPEQRGLFLWGRIPPEELSAESLADKILEQARVFVVPGSIFGSNGDRYIRLSLCSKPEILQQALERIINTHL